MGGDIVSDLYGVPEEDTKTREYIKKATGVAGGILGAAPLRGLGVAGEIIGQGYGANVARRLGAEKGSAEEMAGEIAGTYYGGKAAAKGINVGSKAAVGLLNKIPSGGAAPLKTPKISGPSFLGGAGFVGGMHLAEPIKKALGIENQWGQLAVDLGAGTVGSAAGEVAQKLGTKGAQKIGEKLLGKAATAAVGKGLGVLGPVGAVAAAAQTGWDVGRAAQEMVSDKFGAQDAASKSARAATKEMSFWDLTKETLGFGQAGRAAEQEAALQKAEQERLERLQKLKKGTATKIGETEAEKALKGSGLVGAFENYQITTKTKLVLDEQFLASIERSIEKLLAKQAEEALAKQLAKQTEKAAEKAVAKPVTVAEPELNTLKTIEVPITHPIVKVEKTPEQTAIDIITSGAEPKTGSELSIPESDVLEVPKTETQLAPKTETATETQLAPKTETAIETATKNETNQETKTKLALDIKLEPTTKTEPKPHTEISTKPKPQTQTEITPAQPTVSTPKPIKNTETKPKTEPSTKTETKLGEKSGIGSKIASGLLSAGIKSPEATSAPLMDPRMTDVRYGALRNMAMGVMPIYEGVYNPKMSLQNKSKKQKYKIVVVQEGGKKVELFASSVQGIKRAVYGKKNYKVYDAKGTDISGYFGRLQKKVKKK